MNIETVDFLRRRVQEEFARTEPPAGFPDLPTIPPGRYTDPAFFELEKERIFDRAWLYAASTWDFPEVGSFKVFDNMGRTPILLIRGADDEVRAFYNTCQHRGAPVVATETGTIPGGRLRCQFHSWTYDLEGTLVAIPGPRDFSPNLDKCKHNLKPVRCESWNGFVFINLGDDAPDLRTWLGPMVEDMDWIDGMRPVITQVQIADCNWKIAIEAFVEVYHVTTIHPDTVSRLIDYRGTVSTFYPHGHSRMIVPVHLDSQPKPPENGEGADWDAGRWMRRESNVSYQWFPNVLTPADETGFMLFEFQPIDMEHTKISVTGMQPDWGEDEPTAQQQKDARVFGRILAEDMWNMNHIQRSVMSPSFAGPKCSYHEQRVYFIEESVDRMIGRDRVPAHLRVEPLLDKYIVKTNAE